MAKRYKGGRTFYMVGSVPLLGLEAPLVGKLAPRAIISGLVQLPDGPIGSNRFTFTAIYQRRTHGV